MDFWPSSHIDVKFEMVLYVPNRATVHPSRDLAIAHGQEAK
jgi:hypothetical protein